MNHIEFMTDIERAYHASHVFILPSNGEGMPNAMLEGMASGLPPIGTEISGIEDLIGHDCGQFIKRDGKEIAAAVLRYYRDHATLSRHRLRARRIIEEDFSASTAASRLLDLIASFSRNSCL